MPHPITQKILTWFDQHGRKDLPWQINKTPYRVWVSEIMLQQTQVNTVIPYYQHFMARFPDISALAAADEDEVLHFWTGLGYYNRARNLHRAAQICSKFYQNNLPCQPENLIKLPGIGKSTAGAILTLAFQIPAPILDGNVKRVLTRLHGITDWPGEKKIIEELWQLAENYTPSTRCADYTQAIMDFGATLCIKSKPHCSTCPLQNDCRAYTLGLEKTVPRAKPRKVLPVRQTTVLIIQKQPHHVFLQKRNLRGVWQGLWSLPEIAGDPTLADIAQFCQQHWQFKLDKLRIETAFRHTFSHYHLDITPCFARLASAKSKIMEDNQQIWYNLHATQKVGMPAPIKQLLRTLS